MSLILWTAIEIADKAVTNSSGQVHTAENITLLQSNVCYVHVFRTSGREKVPVLNDILIFF